MKSIILTILVTIAVMSKAQSFALDFAPTLTKNAQVANDIQN